MRSVWLIRNDILYKGGKKGVNEIILLEKSLSSNWLGARYKGRLVCTKVYLMLNPLGRMR